MLEEEVAQKRKEVVDAICAVLPMHASISLLEDGSIVQQTQSGSVQWRAPQIKLPSTELPADSGADVLALSQPESAHTHGSGDKSLNYLLSSATINSGMVQVTRKDQKEANENVIRRFNRKVLQSGVLAEERQRCVLRNHCQKAERRKKAIIRRERRAEKTAKMRLGVRQWLRCSSVLPMR